MKTTILYLEDDEALSFVTCRALERKGYMVRHALDIPSFRQLFTKVHFDCALLDLKIGNDASFDLIQEIKAINDVPIVILSGYGTVRTAVQAMKLGAVDFLSKPCGIDEVIEALSINSESVVSEQSESNVEVELNKPSLKALEREAIQKALDDNDGNISAAARQLKMHRRTLQRKLIKRHVDQDDSF